jgi:hypothetical protein
MSDQILRVHNTSDLVRTLQILLNETLFPSPNLPGGTHFGQKTEQAVIQFQTTNNLSRTDGVVDAETWRALRSQVGQNMEQIHRWHQRSRATTPVTVPSWLWGINGGFTRLAPFDFDRQTFFEMYIDQFGALPSDQLDALNLLLDFMEDDTDISDIRWFAYMLATVKAEHSDFKPGPESHALWSQHTGPGDYAEEVAAPDGSLHRYFGRGYVQLTWLKNYKSVGNGIGMGDQLANNPDLAMDPNTAYSVMSYGMRNRTFTGKELSDYINGNNADYVNARRIINGLNRAQEIAGYATAFETMLNTSWRLIPIPSPAFRFTP